MKVRTSVNRSSFLLIVCFSGLLLVTVAFGGDVDPRFDGRWVGTETFQFGYSGYSGAPSAGNGMASNIGMSVSRDVSRQSQTVPAIIGIADHGKTVGITKGFGKGRYELVPEKSGGNKLEFRMPGTNGDKLLYVGLQHCTLTLSADGNTLKETGTAILSVSKSGQSTSSQVYGTFKRQGHY